MVTSSYDTVGGDLPLVLGSGQGTISSVLDANFDVFLDNSIGLNLHITRDTPYRRETAQWRKEQIDQAPEAGEQTLSSWWIRSQMSFHGGAGLKYLDTVVDRDASADRIRFDDSRGIDVWTQGEVKRLPDTEFLVATSGQTWLYSTTIGAESYLVYGSATLVKAIRKVAADTITYTITGMSGTIKSMVIDGTHYYVATSDAKIFKGPIDDSEPGVEIWDFVDSTATVTLGWSKQRLMAGVNNVVYELEGIGPTLPDALYTHPSEGWVWTAFCDAPDAVIGAGYSGLNSGVIAFSLTDVSGAPELAPGVAIADMPVGERVYSMYLYVGSRLAIGTDKGLRVGQFDNLYGAFTYGPLTVETEGKVTAICGRGAFIFAGTTVDAEPALLRVDLGTETESGRFAWATDLRVEDEGQDGEITGLTVDSDGLLAFAVNDYGLNRETTTYTGRTAWLRTARIRMTTVEPKRYKRGRIRTEGVGSIIVYAVTNASEEVSVYNQLTNVDTEQFDLPSNRAEWLQMRFELSDSGTMTSYQVLALPAQPRQRLFALPVAIFDREKNRHGRPVGYDGRASEILNYLEALESSGEEVVVQCPVLGIEAVRCVVERIEFFQQSPPVAGKRLSLGGYGNLVFRTLT
jgi:hypothetical protein